MLILRRKAGESIVIGGDIRVTVVDINEGSIRLAIDAPKQITILRSELLQAAEENRSASHAEASPHKLLSALPGGSAERKFPAKRPPQSAPDPAPESSPGAAAE